MGDKFLLYGGLSGSALDCKNQFDKTIELPKEKFSNPDLLKRALDHLRDGDIFMAHLGIWSRQQAWMPENLEPLISGLEKKGFCFATLREHPAYRIKTEPKY
jgi:hypothetical protein